MICQITVIKLWQLQQLQRLQGSVQDVRTDINMEFKEECLLYSTKCTMGYTKIFIYSDNLNKAFHCFPNHIFTKNILTYK